MEQLDAAPVAARHDRLRVRTEEDVDVKLVELIRVNDRIRRQPERRVQPGRVMPTQPVLVGPAEPARHHHLHPGVLSQCVEQRTKAHEVHRRVAGEQHPRHPNATSAAAIDGTPARQPFRAGAFDVADGRPSASIAGQIRVRAAARSSG